MPSRLQALQQEAADLVAKSGGLVAKAETESRALNEVELAEEKAIDARLAAIEQEKQPLLRQQERERALGSALFAERGADEHGGGAPSPRVGAVRDLAAERPWGATPREALGAFLQAVARVETHNFIDPRLRREAAATGMGEAVPSDGGFLVQADMASLLLDQLWAEAVLAPRCREFPISNPSNRIEIDAVDQRSRADGSRWGGVQVYWGDEGTAPTASKPKTRKIKLDLKKVSGLCYVTDELLQDAAALEAFVSTAFLEEFTYEIDDQIINGDGSGKPLGILNSDALISVAKETGQAAATLVYENIIKIWARCWARGWPNAIWICNQDVLPQLFSLSLAVGTGGVPVYLPANGLAGSPYGTLFSRPVIPVEQCATLGTVGDILLVDLTQYLLARKRGIEAASSIHVRFTQQEMTYRWRLRIDGQPRWFTAVTPAKGSNTQSPFIALATRA